MARTSRNTRTVNLENLENLANAAIARVESARKTAFARVDDARARGAAVATHLEKVFEQRVSQAISRLGMPTHREMRALSREIAALKASVEKLRRSRTRARA